MRIKCWGSRGSIPVSGRDFIEYGGDTTCFEVETASGDIIIVDAGTGIRNLGKSLVKRKKNRFTMLLTHVHWDHILGLSFFAPLLSKDTRLNVQDRTFGRLKTRDVFEQVMTSPFFPVKMTDFNADIRFDPSLNGRFHIGSVTIEMIAVSHSKDTMGYKFSENGRSFVFMTDNELGYDHPDSSGMAAFTRFAAGADLLFHDAEYNPEEYNSRKGWGHSSISQVLDFAQKARVRQLGLIHLNQDRTDARMNEMVDTCVRTLKDSKSSIRCFGVPAGFELTL